MRKLVIALAMLAAPASAQPLQAQLSRCLAIPGVLQRLACYDGVAKGAGAVAPPPRAAAAPIPAPIYRQPPPAIAYAPPPAPIGLGSERLPQPAPATAAREAQALVAQVTKVTFDPYGRFTMTFDDGQVWRQVPGDQTFLHGQKVRSVRISRGALGSYDLTVTGLNATYKVTRVQ